MYPLKMYNPDAILLWWASKPQYRGEDINHVIKMGQMHYIDQEDLTVPKVRRYVRKLLYTYNLLPTHRAPTDQDYTNAKQRFLKAWFDTDIV